ncbi:MAG: hypothetical protein ABIJ95_06030, partial [Pseudomonadota bacterium]
MSLPLPDPQENHGPAPASRLKKLLSLSKTLFTPLALACIAWFAWTHRDFLAQALATAKGERLVAAVLVWAGIQMLGALFARTAFASVGLRVPFAAALAIHGRRMPARYIPGGVWHTVGRVLDYRSLGAGPRQLALFVFLENAMMPAAAFVMGGILVWRLHPSPGWASAGAAGAAVGAAGLLAVPFLANRLILRRPPGPGILRTLALAAICAAFWFLAATAFYLYVSAFPGAEIGGSFLQVAGTYLFSWAVGFISLFAPQGIGVFEAVAGEMLTGPASLGGLAALVAGFRLTVLAADLLVFAAT